MVENFIKRKDIFLADLCFPSYITCSLNHLHHKMKNTYSQVRLIAFALFFLTLLTTNSCRKDKSAIIENTQALVDRLDSKERIQTSEINIWLKNNLDSVMLKDVHLSVTEQNVIGGHHLIRVSIGLDAALYFVKSGGELNVWAYKWLDKQPGDKTFTGNVVSYS